MSHLDDLSEMTASYSEICDEDEELPEENGESLGGGKRPDELAVGGRGLAGLDRLEGTLTQHGELISFVADDLEEKLRSPTFPQAPSGPMGLLSDLETQASTVATAIDSLVEHLADTLHGISALSADCIETYRDAVCKTCDTLDSNIKSMYQLMAKCEELTKAMQPIHKLQSQVKNMKHVLDLLEATGI